MTTLDKADEVPRPPDLTALDRLRLFVKRKRDFERLHSKQPSADDERPVISPPTGDPEGEE